MTPPRLKRQILTVPRDWTTPAQQRKRARRIARSAAGRLVASIGEMAIARQMERIETGRDNGA